MSLDAGFRHPVGDPKNKLLRFKEEFDHRFMGVQQNISRTADGSVFWDSAGQIVACATVSGAGAGVGAFLAKGKFSKVAVAAACTGIGLYFLCKGMTEKATQRGRARDLSMLLGATQSFQNEIRSRLTASILHRFLFQLPELADEGIRDMAEFFVQRVLLLAEEFCEARYSMLQASEVAHTIREFDRFFQANMVPSAKDAFWSNYKNIFGMKKAIRTLLCPVTGKSRDGWRLQSLLMYSGLIFHTGHDFIPAISMLKERRGFSFNKPCDRSDKYPPQVVAAALRHMYGDFEAIVERHERYKYFVFYLEHLRAVRERSEASSLETNTSVAGEVHINVGEVEGQRNDVVSERSTGHSQSEGVVIDTSLADPATSNEFILRVSKPSPRQREDDPSQELSVLEEDDLPIVPDYYTLYGCY